MVNKKLNNSIQKILNDGKAENIISISLKGKSSIADYMIIASGSSTRHVSALSSQVATKLKTLGYEVYSIEGQRSGDWALVDAGDVIVHLFRPVVRDFYNLDKMWLAPKDKALEESI